MGKRNSKQLVPDEADAYTELRGIVDPMAQLYQQTAPPTKWDQAVVGLPSLREEESSEAVRRIYQHLNKEKIRDDFEVPAGPFAIIVLGEMMAAIEKLPGANRETKRNVYNDIERCKDLVMARVIPELDDGRDEGRKQLRKMFKMMKKLFPDDIPIPSLRSLAPQRKRMRKEPAPQWSEWKCN